MIRKNQMYMLKERIESSWNYKLSNSNEMTKNNVNTEFTPLMKYIKEQIETLFKVKIGYC